MAEPLKNQFDRNLVQLLARRFSAMHPAFDGDAFTAAVLRDFPELELKDRINRVADELAERLPPDYPAALAIVVRVASHNDEEVVDGFAAWPLCSFIERHGLDHPEESLTAMEVLTRRFSCEFALRPFLEHHLATTRRYVRKWVTSPDEAVRRLSSEGTRSHLPWGPRVAALIDDPGIGLEVLEHLRHDPAETVRRSVANHLNDLARTHPDLVVAVAKRWSSDPAVEPAMIRHALRTLVKKGHPEALSVLGFTTDPAVRVEAFALTPTELHLGEAVSLVAAITSTARAEQRLVVDFVVHHVTATGSTTPKVFKWTTLSLEPGETAEIAKRRRIATASTRRYHAGRHRVDLQIAGQTMASTAFDLLDSS